MNTGISIHYDDVMRTHVVIPKVLIKQVDTLVGTRGRSKFIVAAVADRIKTLRLAQAANKVAGSLTKTYIPEWDSSEKAAAWVHTLRQNADNQREHQHGF